MASTKATMNSININPLATFAARSLNGHYGRLSTSIARLSSGLRVNSAADDAAGLAVRELMRADLAALHQGQRNASDAISMLQVADAALGIIDEKLIRMKELAEQAATGTYDSTQRLMIDSEFQAMAAEINRIASATDFNGIKLLDGSLSGSHDGGGISAKGAMKIHFGSGNDSAEDYYYVDIGDCTVAGLFGFSTSGSAAPAAPAPPSPPVEGQPLEGHIPLNSPENDFYLNDHTSNTGKSYSVPRDVVTNIQDLGFEQGVWYITPNWLTSTPAGGGESNENFIFRIPKGSRNLLINMAGCISGVGDNDLEIFTADGLHLMGTPAHDWVFSLNGGNLDKKINAYKDYLGFDSTQYDASILNTGPNVCDRETLRYTYYNGMALGYSGDPERSLGVKPNDGNVDANEPDFEVFTIDEATEDLIVWLTGKAPALIQIYWDVPDDVFNNTGGAIPQPPPAAGEVQKLDIKTQAKAQEMLETIDGAIARKDGIRAHLGALQNRLENTVANLSIQANNLQASESRISDADIATEMTEFVRNQVLTQTAVAMLSQANSYPHLLSRLLEE